MPRHYYRSDVAGNRERSLTAAVDLLGSGGIRALTHGRVDAADARVLIEHFGRTIPGVSGGYSATDWSLISAFAGSIGVAAPVPEPAAGTALLATAVGLLRRRQRR